MLFYVIMGQIDDTTKEKMSMEAKWAEIKKDFITVKMQHSSFLFKPLHCLQLDQKVYLHWRYKAESTTDYYKHLRTCQEIYALMDVSFEEEALITIFADNKKTMADFKYGTMNKADKLTYITK